MLERECTLGPRPSTNSCVSFMHLPFCWGKHFNSGLYFRSPLPFFSFSFCQKWIHLHCCDVGEVVQLWGWHLKFTSAVAFLSRLWPEIVFPNTRLVTFQQINMKLLLKAIRRMAFIACNVNAKFCLGFFFNLSLTAFRRPTYPKPLPDVIYSKKCFLILLLRGQDPC